MPNTFDNDHSMSLHDHFQSCRGAVLNNDLQGRSYPQYSLQPTSLLPVSHSKMSLHLLIQECMSTDTT